VIIWINGGFGAGKSTLAEELRRRLPDAVLYDPEVVGYALWDWLPRTGDFQDLPSWRELVVASALSLRKHHAETLITPMTLIRDEYRTEIFGALAAAGEPLLHVYLDLDAGVLRQRIADRVMHPGKPELDENAREFCLSHLDAAVSAVDRLPAGTLLLRSDQLAPAELADRVLAAAQPGNQHPDLRGRVRQRGVANRAVARLPVPYSRTTYSARSPRMRWATAAMTRPC
jgi:AAA domain